MLALCRRLTVRMHELLYDEHDALFFLCRSIAANHLSHRLSFALIVHRRLITQIVLGCGDDNLQLVLCMGSPRSHNMTGSHHLSPDQS